MKRVLVLGCPASGKSTLARVIAADTGLPIVHLDRIYWRSGWIESSEEEFRARLAIEIEKEAWIIDGNYANAITPRLRFADTAIVLDFPRWRCLWRAVKRSLWGWGKSRTDMADGCRERLDPEFLKFIWNFRRDYRPRLFGELERFTGERILLHSPTDVKRFVESLHRPR